MHKGVHIVHTEEISDLKISADCGLLGYWDLSWQSNPLPMPAVFIEAQDHITDNWIIDIVAVCSAKKKPLRKNFPKIASSFRRCVGTIETTTTASMLGIFGFSGLVVMLC